MKAATVWRPASEDERYPAIDIIRGLALFGVLIVNLQTMFRVPLLEYILRPHTDPGIANHLVDFLVRVGLEFKAFTTFSFLFGVGVAIQAERAEARHVDARIFLFRRLMWLLIFGVIHLFLIWNGDILTLYAFCGLLLLPFPRMRWQVLFAIGAALIVFSEVVPLGMHFPTGEAATAEIAQARLIYGDQGFLPILKFRFSENWSLIVPLLISVLPRTAGLMYWGMAAWRSGIMREPRRFRGQLVASALFGLVAGEVFTLNDYWASSGGKAFWPLLRVLHVDPSILLALAYVSALLLWLGSARSGSLPGLAALGRMALSNYLAQSILLGFVFYGYGLGLFGRMSPAVGAVLGLILYIVQVQLSRLWLRRFRFGPFEWLWRSLTYWQRQPMTNSNR